MTVTAPNGVYGPVRTVEGSSYAFTPPAVGSSRQVFSDATGRRSRVFRVVEALAKLVALAFVAIAVAVLLDVATGGADSGFDKQTSVVGFDHHDSAIVDARSSNERPAARVSAESSSGATVVGAGQP